ncbi:6999_t:CDS:2 [Racocetra persica]|uniref:6999_t:CDS:1 n=1 Tax=Racocetra persica TaxID=160502 RepID=A0ACA9KVK8_9GLOM|nr:6999_t:CDS:2 [Racocetra persica]
MEQGEIRKGLEENTQLSDQVGADSNDDEVINSNELPNAESQGNTLSSVKSKKKKKKKKSNSAKESPEKNNTVIDTNAKVERSKKNQKSNSDLDEVVAHILGHPESHSPKCAEKIKNSSKSEFKQESMRFITQERRNPGSTNAKKFNVEKSVLKYKYILIES